MAQFPGLTLWTDAWVADTAHLSVERRGLYHDMLVLAWRTPGCRLPCDRAWLLVHLRLTFNGSRSTAADHLEPIIGEYWTADGNWLTQKRLTKEYLRAFERSKRLSDLHKSRKNKKKYINGSRSTATDDRQPSGNPLPLPLIDSSLTGTESQGDTPQQEKEEDKAPRSLASALPSGALAHSAVDEPGEIKQKIGPTSELKALIAGKRWDR